MSRKRYLFFDIDGTLLADGPLGYVPESTRRAIKKLEEAGHFVSIATGRAQFMAEPYMRMLEMENMVSDGGNGITIGGKLIGIEPLNKADVVALVRECEERGFPWGLAVDNNDTGNHLTTQSLEQVTVRIKQELIFPLVLIHQRFHLVNVLGLVDAHSKDFHTSLLLPLVIDLGYSRQLAVARLAPCGKEIDDERLAIVGKRFTLNSSAINTLECDNRKLCLCHSKTGQQAND